MADAVIVGPWIATQLQQAPRCAGHCRFYPRELSSSHIRAVPHFGGTGFGSAVRTAIEVFIALHSVADDPATTMAAGRRKHIDGALEAVEHVRLAVHRCVEQEG